jgi:hypothetical protein
MNRKSNGFGFPIESPPRWKRGGNEPVNGPVSDANPVRLPALRESSAGVSCRNQRWHRVPTSLFIKGVFFFTKEELI